MAGNVLSVATSGTNVYKSVATRFSGKSRDVTWVYTTTGTLTGTLIVEGSNSDESLIERDAAGGTNVTDQATWVQYKHLLQNDGTAGHNVAISGAGSDYIEVVDAPFKAMRARYTNATNTGQLDIDASAKGDTY